LQVFAIASLLPLTYLSWDSARNADGPQKNRLYKRCMIVVLIGTLINLGWGSYRVYQIQQQAADFSGDHLNVGVLQGDTEYAGSNESFAKRSRELTRCDLILWPECSFGKYQQDLVDFSDETEVLKKSTGIGYQFRPLPDPNSYLLGGGYSWTPRNDPEAQAAFQEKYGFPKKPEIDQKYVSAFLLDPKEQLVGRHDKIELMAGGEYVPFAGVFPWLDDWLVEEATDGVLLSRGQKAMPIGDVNGVSVAALLCCEDMYPRLSSEMSRQGADLIVCLTNGMSFNSGIALQQHFNIGRFRAVENNRYFIRCGSHGISGIIMPDGSVQQTAPCFQEQELRLQVPRQKRTATWFSRFGDTLTPASYFMLLGMMILNGYRITTKNF